MSWFSKKKEKKDITEKPAETPPPEAEAEEPEEPFDTAEPEESVAPEAPPETVAEAETPTGTGKGPGLFNRLKSGLSKTRAVLTTDIDDLFLGGKKLEGEALEQLEEMLITADMGVETTMDIIDRLSRKRISSGNELKEALKDEVIDLMDRIAKPDAAIVGSHRPHIIMVVGVNGVGKTTTIGKLAARFSEDGKSVIVGAADTFRAAAVEQLAIWTDRAGAEIVRHREHADPAAVAFDAVEAAVARDRDVVIVDTAGRLHTKVNLMEELKKIHRAITKKIPEAPHEVLLVLDATTGQNALSQARMFNEALEVTGLVLTKLDGTARGGVVISICNSLDIPIKYIGVGEGIDDLQVFDPVRFADALFG